MQKIKLGTRGSQLALWQASHIESLLKTHHPQLKVERIIIHTEGDRDQNSSLTQIGGQGVFTKAIEQALLDGRIDIAVHSLKDLPSQMADGLALGAVPQRGPVEDVLVTNDGKSYSDLTTGATVATGSIRRRSQLQRLRPDLKMVDLRGNIDTRLRKLREQNLDGIIMARAALLRLELDEVRFSVFPVEDMVPGVGQGAVGVQIRSNDAATGAVIAALNDYPSRQAVDAERAVLYTLDSGCQFPIGAYARLDGEHLTCSAYVGNMDGTKRIVDSIEGPADQAEQLGRSLGEKLIAAGARDILDQFTHA